MNWLIAYAAGALVFAFVVIIVSVAFEDEDDQERTFMRLPVMAIFWPLSAVVVLAAFIGLTLKGR